ncbi:MAG TPA: ABC transporter permease [Anaerolineales bacterium]|nr:ABC transporter permease [Anaerolineales bacterium]
MRSLLTMLGVIIGVAAVIIMVSISRGTEKTIEEQITTLGSNLLYVQASMMRGGPGQPQTGGLVYDDAFTIAKNVAGVQGVVVEQSASGDVKGGSVTVEEVTILGTTTDFPSVRDIDVGLGRYFTDTDLDRKQKVAVLGATLAQELFGETTAIGQIVTVNNVKLTVVGVMAESGITGNVDYDTYLFTPITVVFDKFNFDMFARMFGDSVRVIYVEVEDKSLIDQVTYGIQVLLAKHHEVSLDSLDFVVRSQDDIIETQESTTAAFRSLLGWVAGVSLFVGGIGIMNIMMVSVTERTREIGIRQSVGATPNNIRWQFLTEALLLSLVGGLIGVLAGVGGSWLFGKLGDMRTLVTVSSILLAFGSAAAVGVFFGFYPANKAAQLDPIQALRHE